MHTGGNHRLWVGINWFQNLVYPFVSSVTLDKSLDFSVPYFSHRKCRLTVVPISPSYCGHVAVMGKVHREGACLLLFLFPLLLLPAFVT